MVNRVPPAFLWVIFQRWQNGERNECSQEDINKVSQNVKLI
jgi:hypothetical protein